MAGPLQHSDSVIASLCREAAAIRVRSRQVLDTLSRCEHLGLQHRLVAELFWLQRRRQELRAMAGGWQRRGASDPLAMAFFFELASRPLASAGPGEWGMANSG